MLRDSPDQDDDESWQVELKELTNLVEVHADSLREASRRGKFELDRFQFRFIKRDKNTVYYVTGDHAWYLKLPVSIRERMMQRESLGVRVTSESLPYVQGYYAARAATVSLLKGYILVAEVRGLPLNRFLYMSAFRMPGFDQSGLCRVYENLGRTLGQLHNLPVQEDLIESDRSVRKTASRWSPEDCSDQKLRQVMELALKKVPNAATNCLVHGNPRMDNILVKNESVSLIDFENTGIGSPYDDLSIVCSQLEVLRALLWFPETAPGKARRTFLDAYRNEHDIDEAILRDCVAIRLVEFYREYARKGGRIAGIPIISRKLHSLVIEMLA
ncbi:phosphotransferase family protein [Thiohalophilus thiocyanatoxydans]|uniref:Phosphotransferase family enzyme n=1 Tax=Thiohalophilus thiocyanatoxydans TaxID=381308 RepID=A0A4R8ITN0_9GAMM|nr:aminoglycoside phosphotransferase family protein [Thiohalophilus thiocyanatoxydans]TDY00959.1 phosphotransferase family enzyme [Thiohalophilus thiocyanatoxydans]